MTVTKVMSTHLQLTAYGVLHVEGSRADVIKKIDSLSMGYSLGLDLPILVRENPADRTLPYKRTQLWVGMIALSEAMIADEHEVDVDESPLNFNAHKAEDLSGLEVAL